MTPSERITAAVTSWDGVEAGPGRRGEFAFRLGHRELGHLHGDHSAHFSFPRARWEELAAEGRIAEHPIFPGKHGPASRRIENDTDVDDVIALMRINYDAALERRGGRGTRGLGGGRGPGEGRPRDGLGTRPSRPRPGSAVAVAERAG